MKRTRIDSESKSSSLGWVREAPRILVIQQKMIGDVLVSSLICENLKRNYPNSEIHYLINRFTIPVIENNPYIDEVIVFEDLYRSNKIEFFKFLKKIKKSNYDVVIDAYGKLESNLTTLSSGAKTKISWKKSHTKFIYTHLFKNSTKPKTNAGIAIEDRLRLLAPLNLKLPLITRPRIYLTDAEISKARGLLEQSKINMTKPLYMISVLGSSSIKSYPFEYMAIVLDYIIESTNAQLLFNYVPNQKEEVLDIYNLCKKQTQKQIFIEIKPNSIREFLAMTSSCDALIGNEGGAVNMAKAIQIPTFTIFSPWIDKKVWSSFEDGNQNVSIHLDELIPDYYSGKKIRSLKAKSLELYRKLSPDKVIKKLDGFLLNIKE